MFGAGVVAGVSIGGAAYDSESVAVVLDSGMTGSNALPNEGVVVSLMEMEESPLLVEEKEQKSAGAALAEPGGDESPVGRNRDLGR